MKRIIIALVMVLLLLFSIPVYALNDIYNLPIEEKTAIQELVNSGILSGYTDGSFRPKEPLERQHFAKYIVNALGLKPITPANPTFPDISPSMTLYSYIETAAKYNLIKGTASGTFEPTRSLKKGEAAVIIVRALEGAQGSYSSQVTRAKVLGLIGSNEDPGAIANRGGAAVSISMGLKLMSSSQLLTVHFIDVGQGDAILVQSPNGASMLIDAGPEIAGQKIVSYLNKAGITSIDVVVATNPNDDHIGGMQDVFDNFAVKKVYDSGFPQATKTYEDFITTIDIKNIPYETAHRGNTINLDKDLNISIFHPGTTLSDAKNNSIVLRLTYRAVTFMLTGDVENEAESLILDVASGTDLSAQVLKVANHGSKTSTSAEFLALVNPEIAIIQSGSGNPYGYPHTETLDQLASSGVKIYRNDMAGDIVFASNGYTHSVNVQPFTHNLPRDYFPLTQGSTWAYLGEGNEYASFTREVLYAERDLAQITESNGGTVMTRIFRTTKDAVIGVYNLGEDYSPENLLDREPNEHTTILKSPLAVGTKWTEDNVVREIVDIAARVETPAGTFTDCLKVKSISGDESILYDYYSKGVGLVKREFFYGETEPVTSTLESYNIIKEGA